MKQKKTQPYSPFLYYDFQKIWRYFPVPRSTKEFVKYILFQLFPFVFQKLAIYQNWKNARVFASRFFQRGQPCFWQLIFHRQCIVRYPKSPTNKSNEREIKNLAIVIHVFYLDVLKEIMDKISPLKRTSMDLYITTPIENTQQIKIHIPEIFGKVVIKTVPNHGRDILPFLQILPQILQEGYPVVLKLHTKKSNHLHRKQQWRTALFQELLGPGKMEKGITSFETDSTIGMIGPSGNILSMELHYGANGARLHQLAHKMGLANHQISSLHFIAGSMFYAHTKILKSLVNLNLTSEDFEPENGQTDGTMAHAVERAFTLGLIKWNLKLIDTDYSTDYIGYKVSKNHYFTC